MNKPVVFLRVASVLTLVHAVLHTIGGVFGKTAPGPAAVAVAAMKANQFPLMGNMRSFWDFYFGLGLALSISMTAEAILMWQLASLAKTEARRLRPMMATFLVAYRRRGQPERDSICRLWYPPPSEASSLSPSSQVTRRQEP
jgi:hypothetical protein